MTRSNTPQRIADYPGGLAAGEWLLERALNAVSHSLPFATAHGHGLTVAVYRDDAGELAVVTNEAELRSWAVGADWRTEYPWAAKARSKKR